MNGLITQIHDLDSVFDQLWRGSCRTPVASTGGESAERTLRPRADVFENETEYHVHADLPGVSKDDLKVEIERNVLSISGERKVQTSDDLQSLHVERVSNARFVRTFTLGQSVDSERIKARFTNGVLELTIPKTEKALPRRINVE